MAQPWNDYPKAGHPWDTAKFPYIVRWSVSYPDRLTTWITHIREFASLEEAVAAYKRPFKGLSVDLMMFNGGRPGQHMDQLARRKAAKPTEWSEKVPQELRGAA